MRYLILPIALLFAGMPATAQADVEVGFWSRELGLELPHAFVTVKGTVAGKPVDTSYGFTAKAITPAILFGTVPGRIDITTRGYIAASHRHFSIIVPDAAYDRLMAVVAAWNAKPGSIYDMNTHNCVTFVGEAARAIGLKVAVDRALMKRPTSFLLAIEHLNPQVSPAQVTAR